MTRKSTHPNSPPKPPKLLDNAEIQSLADAALQAWETHVERLTTDSAGARWGFYPVTEKGAGLELWRATGETPLRQGKFDFLSGAALGVDAIRAVLASRVLAMAS